MWLSQLHDVFTSTHGLRLDFTSTGLDPRLTHPPVFTMPEAPAPSPPARRYLKQSPECVTVLGNINHLSALIAPN